MEVHYLFAGIGMIILIGFLGTLLFDRTKIPDILILIFIGLLIGPILSNYTSVGLLRDQQVVDTLTTIAPHFAALALVIILFDGGLHLHLEKTMKKLGLAILHTGMCFLGSMVVTALVCFYILNMDIFIGLLLGAIIGGTSGAVVIPIMLRSCAREDTRILLTLESVLTDVFCIVTALIFIEVLKGSTPEAGLLLQRVLSSFVLAGFIAFLFGVFWLMILRKMEGRPFAFMVTIAALLVLYAMCEYIEVSGAIAALVFGLVLSNKDEIARILKFKGSFVLDEHIMQFHSEVSFLVRTFFFVYLGMTFTFVIGAEAFGNLAGWIPNWISWHPALVLGLLLSLIFIGILVVRYIVSSVICMVHKESRPDKTYMVSMVGRGLAAAVLATLPFTIPEFFERTEDGLPSAYNLLMEPYQSLFLNTAFIIIVLSVITTTIGVFVLERKRMAEETCMPEHDTGGDWAVKSPTYRKAVESAPKKPAAKSAGKEGPKPWVGPAIPPATIRHQKAVPPKRSEPSPRTPSKPQPHRTPPPAHAKPPVMHSSKSHPLVKRAAESEKAHPKKPAGKPKK